jgi:hypothetical protein
VSQEEQQAQRDQLVRAAGFAVDAVLADTPTYRVLPPAQQTTVTLEAAFGYLLAHRLITVLPDDQWPAWLSLDIPEHLVPDIAGRVKRRAEVEQRIRAAASGS